MALGERERLCLEYLCSVTGESIKESQLEFFTWKNTLGIRNIDFFHIVAQALKQKTLISVPGQEVFYYIQVPPEEKSNHWCVTLLESQNRQFLEKYKKYYEIKDYRDAR